MGDFFALNHAPKFIFNAIVGIFDSSLTAPSVILAFDSSISSIKARWEGLRFATTFLNAVWLTATSSSSRVAVSWYECGFEAARDRNVGMKMAIAI